MNKSKILKTSLSIIIILSIWTIVTEMGLISSYILPSPLKVLDSFIKMVQSGEIFEDIYISPRLLYHILSVRHSSLSFFKDN